MFPKNTLMWQDAEPNVALYRYGAAGEELGKGSRYSTIHRGSPTSRQYLLTNFFTFCLPCLIPTADPYPAVHHPNTTVPSWPCLCLTDDPFATSSRSTTPPPFVMDAQANLS